MTAIEEALFVNGSAHWVSSFDLTLEALVLTLHPCNCPDMVTQARFEKPCIISTDDTYADDDSNLPWDIIGFDSKPLADGLWDFCLHTDAIEYVFESAWPQISKPTCIWSDSPEEPLVMAISEDDADMKAAYRKAAQTLPDFIEHLKIEDERFCSAKLCFRDPEESERLGEDRLVYWWVDFVHFDAEQNVFSGEFTELPDCLKPYHHLGQRLTFEGEDIFDWRVNLEGSLYGGFTIRVARKHIPQADLAEYDNYIGVTEFLDQTAPEAELSR